MWKTRLWVKGRMESTPGRVFRRVHFRAENWRSSLVSWRAMISRWLDGWFGQTIATSHDLDPQKSSFLEWDPSFERNQGWWNIMIWPDFWFQGDFLCSLIFSRSRKLFVSTFGREQQVKMYPWLKGNTRCCDFSYCSCEPFNWPSTWRMTCERDFDFFIFPKIELKPTT